MSKHTLTPWKFMNEIGTYTIETDNRRIAKVLYEGGSDDPEVYWNARFIVRACNSHDDLLVALQVLLDQVDYTTGACRLNEPVGGVLPNEVITRAKQAIAKAKE